MRIFKTSSIVDLKLLKLPVYLVPKLERVVTGFKCTRKRLELNHVLETAIGKSIGVRVSAATL